MTGFKDLEKRSYIPISYYDVMKEDIDFSIYLGEQYDLVNDYCNMFLGSAFEESVEVERPHFSQRSTRVVIPVRDYESLNNVISRNGVSCHRDVLFEEGWSTKHTQILKKDINGYNGVDILCTYKKGNEKEGLNELSTVIESIICEKGLRIPGSQGELFNH